ncbi:phosphatidylinositol-specific phospholipase C domain-containing protein [Microbulbifer sp. YPW1]|uniref:phosphatidylinositol-specific phospholipase C domain-containing protein n=1 Tax=Microbulbifer sp. YPW1 TaxID=2745199 RepID=UPI001598E28C|nr:phosphatidylinositol-specific phospholipase C domain-containing protein [Microbulbifer sp. YPW1]QKX16067.1 hypothetical protein HUW35_03120 [Microbulbifer sp. YPW1]
MEITYFNLGPQRRLHEIIFAGSHDAAITSGKSNAQTQNLNIYEQAKVGVRLFDLRILAQGDEQGASLVAYHGSAKKAKARKMHSDHTNKTHNIEVSSGMNLGTTGLKLSNMLKSAKRFVTEPATKNEFLILKFDKCSNWKLIAETCVAILADKIFKKTNDIEFSKLTLQDLAGKVVCVFNDKALAETPDLTLGPQHGILGFRSLKSKNGPNKAYKPAYQGMQYFGKGGTPISHIWKTKRGKRQENFDKQKKLMLQMANSDDLQSPNVLGMMYWTATGLTHSIKLRDEVLWNRTGVHKLGELWRCGLEASIGHQMELERIKCLEWGGKMRMKAFFPNIVMIDFASYDKCKTIYGLNKLKDDMLARAYDQYVGDVQPAPSSQKQQARPALV